jgi:uncharacterized protein YpmB
MRRSISMISAAATAFIVVILVSVVYGLRASAESRRTLSEAPVASVPAAAPSQLIVASPLTSPHVEARMAADIASRYLNRSDAYSVQLAAYNGVPCYAVTFSSGDVVYVSLEGQVLGSIAAPIQMASTGRGHRDSDEKAGRNDGGGQEHEHESETEHEGDD